MPRISPLQSASGKSEELLGIVKKKMGRVPNMMGTLAQSPAALEMYLQMSGVLSSGQISVQDKERLALRAAHINECEYCDKAHSAIAKMVKVAPEEIESARSGTSTDAKSDAILKFGSAIVEKKGHVSDQDIAVAKSAGVTESEILEIVAHMVFNIYTNYVNHVIEPTIDF